MIRSSAFPLAVVSLALLTLVAGGIGYRLGHDAGRATGRIEAHREADRVLHRLNAAFDGLADMPAAPSGPESTHTANGDTP